MNREAVALGTPVYTTFAGRLGAVDEQLVARTAAAPAALTTRLERRRATRRREPNRTRSIPASLRVRAA